MERLIGFTYYIGITKPHILYLSSPRPSPSPKSKPQVPKGNITFAFGLSLKLMGQPPTPPPKPITYRGAERKYMAECHERVIPGGQQVEENVKDSPP